MATGVLGRSALATAIGPVGIVRSHARALRRLAPARQGGAESGAVFRRAESLLLGVLASALREVTRMERSRASALRERTVALARAKRTLVREQDNTKRAEAELTAEIGRYRELLARSQTTQAQLRRMTQRVLSVQEEERRRISRELHDEIAQILTGINVQLAILKQTSTVNDRAMRRRIARAQRFVEKSVTAVHRFARELRPALLDDLGLIPALRSLIRNLPGRDSLRIRLVTDPGFEVADSARRTVLYRAAQEALTNVTRHARASLATVEVRRHPKGAELEVRDNGRAFDVPRVLASATRKHLGLLGMRERVEMVGGTLAIESAPGRGSVVRVFVPFGKGAGGGSA